MNAFIMLDDVNIEVTPIGIMFCDFQPSEQETIDLLTRQERYELQEYIDSLPTSEIDY